MVTSSARAHFAPLRSAPTASSCAGPEPGLPGEEFLWIIDYKTSDRGTGSLEDFLAAQRAAYAPQLETYTRILAPAQSKSLSQVRLALYFPTLPLLTWWQPGSTLLTGSVSG